MYYGVELSSTTTRTIGNRYLSFESSGALVYKKYAIAPVYENRIEVVRAPTGVTIDPATTYIKALREVPLINNSGVINKTGKSGIQVYINGKLYYEKYLATSASYDGGIYIDDSDPWFWKTSGNMKLSKSSASATVSPGYDIAAGSSISTGIIPVNTVVQRYYTII